MQSVDNQYKLLKRSIKRGEVSLNDLTKEELDIIVNYKKEKNKGTLKTVVDTVVIKEDIKPVVDNTTSTLEIGITETEHVDKQKEETTAQKKTENKKEYYKNYRESEKWKEYYSNYRNNHKDTINSKKRDVHNSRKTLADLVTNLMENKTIIFKNTEDYLKVCNVLKIEPSKYSLDEYKLV